MGRIVGKIQFAFITVLLFTLNGFAGGAIAGKVTIVKGKVFIVRSGEKIQVKKDITVLESDVIESQPGGTARITMIDSNLVDVYPKSKVEISKYVYKPNQDKKNVELKVDFGKIKSTVNQKYDGAKNKFQVKTPSAVAGVRGTVFTAEYDAVKKVSKVVTIEGLVAVTKIIDSERQTPPVFVRPDQVVNVDVEQSKTEQPRELKSEEREERKQEDKDLGYQYDPKKEPTPGESPSSKNEPHAPVKEQPTKEFDHPDKDAQAHEPVRETPPIKEISLREPVKFDKEEHREQQQERRQTASEDEQSKKQKQTEDEQAKKQKQLEEEQARKQKQLEEEQNKKQDQMEEEQTRKQSQLEEEQAKKQQQMEDMLEAKRRHAEEAQAKHEEEQVRRAEEEQVRRAELDRRLAEIANRAEQNIIRLPSGSTGGVTTPTTPINTTIPGL